MKCPSTAKQLLAGADDLTASVGAGNVRAGIVSDENEKLTGPEANCRIGDLSR